MTETSPSPAEIRIQRYERIQQLLEALCQGLYEREEAMKLALLSTLAGESMFLLGPPGVGKSLIARRLKYAFKDGTSFEYLMSKFSTPDEIFGPISIKKLKEEDKYERLTDRYLPGANIVFLDEIWKSGPAIQNALLTILNEKIYRNGEEDLKVDIKGIITASNELPPVKESFQPLWDRLLVRYAIEGIRSNQNFVRMITDTEDPYQDNISDELKITQAELEIWSQEILAVTLPPEVINTLQVTRHKIDTYNQNPNAEHAPIQLFDRRWKKLVQLIRSSAFLNGREEADLMDCFLALHCLWNRPEHFEVVAEIVSKTIREHGYSLTVNLNLIRNELNSFREEVMQEIRVARTYSESQLEPIEERYYEMVVAEKHFQGERIRIEDFHNLSLDDWTVVNVYDQSQTLRHRLKARKPQREHCVEILFNAQSNVYELQTKEIERKEYIAKKPHALLVKHWNQRYEQLSHYIAEQQERLENEKPQALDGLAHNLFVPTHFSKVVTANLREVAETLEQLKLAVEKVQYAYTHA